MADNDIKIYGAVRAMTGDGIAAYAEQIYDTESGKYLPELISESGGIKQAQVGYFVCDTAAATAAKTIAATGYALATGGNIRIKMTNANTADAVTLNINNTGAKALLYNGAQASSTNSWEAGEVVEVYYDGTQYQSVNAVWTAKSLRYNNTKSGLGSNVQETIDYISNLMYCEENKVENILRVGNSCQIDIEGRITSGASNAWSVFYFDVKAGDKIVFILSYTASKDVRFGLFSSVPTVGSVCVDKTFKQINNKNIEYVFVAPIDGYFAYSYYVSGSGSVSAYLSNTLVDFQKEVKKIYNNDFYEIDLEKKALCKGVLSTNRFELASDFGSHIAIPTNGAKRVKIIPRENDTCYFYFLKSYSAPSSDMVPDFCDGYESRQSITQDAIIDIPSDCNYIIIYMWYTQAVSHIPKYIGLSFNDFAKFTIEINDKKISEGLYGIDFAQGSYGTNGRKIYSSAYVHTNLFKGKRTIRVNEDYNIKYLFVWLSENTLSSYTTVNQSIITVPQDEYYYSIVVEKKNGGDIAPNESILKFTNFDNVYDTVINNNIERCKSATLNIIGDSISNPDRSGYSLNTIWWKIMADALGINVGTYSCISGTPVGGTASNSFHNRVSSLTLDGTITIIAGGMNDLGADNVPLGDFNYSSSLSNQIEEDPTLTNNFIPAYRKTIEYILNNNKNTRLYLCTITPRAIKKNNMSDEEYYFPWTNNVTGNNWLEYNDAIRKLAHDYGIGIIDFSNIGMYFQNGYANEDKTVVEGIWTTDGVHPNIAYQRKMGEYATKIIAESMF